MANEADADVSCVPNALQKVRGAADAAAAAAAPFKEDEKFQMDFAAGPRRRERMRQRFALGELGD